MSGMLKRKVNMFIDFNSVFHPTEKQKEEHVKLIGRIIRENAGKCSTCVHARYVQESPYHDYVKCETTGENVGCGKNVCNLYEIIGGDIV